VGIVGRLIKRLNSAMGMTSLIVTHDLTETLRIADRVVMLASGRIHSDLSPEGMQSSTDPFVRQFADGLPDGPVPFHHPARPYAEELFAR
jgi:phospholipid/cholesterol/gamma-HCH transport system ATP-binding protein